MTQDSEQPPSRASFDIGGPSGPGPEGRSVHPVRVSYTQAWLYFLFIVCFLVAWWFPLKLFIQHYAFLKGRAEGPRDAYTFVALAYAGVSSLTNEISPERFKEQLQALRRSGYTAVNLDDVKQLLQKGKPLPRKALLMTFDHARKTSYFDTRSSLRRLGWDAVMFLWTKPIDEQDPANLRWPYINEMIRSRIWAIGAQSDNGFAEVPADATGRLGNFMTTPMWYPRENRYETLEEFKTRLNNDHLRCQEIIEKHTGKKPTVYAFPYGDFGQYDARAVLTRRVNLDLVGQYYDLGFVVGNKALNTRYSDPRRLNRLLVDPQISTADLLARLEKAWPVQGEYKAWNQIASPSAWIVDWGAMTITNNQILLYAPAAVTGAKMWLAGSDLCQDISVRLEFRLRGGQLGVYLRASADEESYVSFGLDSAGNAWVRQKYVGFEPFTLATAQAPINPVAINDLDVYVRDKICFAKLNGRPLFAEQVVIRGASNPGMLELSVWDPDKGKARADISRFALQNQRPAMAEWTPRENRGPYIAGWVSQNAYRLTHLSPPWLRITPRGVIQSGGWDPLLYRMLARAYHLELVPNIWVEQEQWMDIFTPSNLVERVDEIRPDAVFLNMENIENPSLAKLIRWLQISGEQLRQRGVRMMVRLPSILEQATTLPAMLAVVPDVQVAATGDSPLLATLSSQSNKVVAMEAVPMPPEDMNLALYYEITGLASGDGRLTKEARAEMLRQEGHQAYRNAEFSRAAALWSQWNQLEPDNEEPLMLIGDAYLRMFDTTKALEYYSRSLAINPGQIDLAIRRIKLIDESGQAEEALKLLNLYARVFPNNSEITLAQADWLMRHNRRREATDLIKRVLAMYPDSITALTMMQGLLENPADRYANMRRLRDVGEVTLMQMRLGETIWYNELMGLPEFCVMSKFVEQVVQKSTSENLNTIYSRFLPRAAPVIEDFSLGKLSSNWLTSTDYPGEEGRIHLRAGRAQAEVYLRLLGSDTMRNGFIEGVLDDVRGFFWLYARRMRQDMIRCGFDQSGNIYLQVWQRGNLLVNESRPWFKPRGKIKLRLEVQGDGANGYVDGRPVFGASVPIPRDMGLGWWGMAPYAVKLGTANATLHYLTAGPLPVQIALLPERMKEDLLLEKFKPFAASLSAVAPQWFTQMPDGRLQGDIVNEDIIIRMFTRYHRMRLLPVIQMADYDMMTGDILSKTARKNHVAGFIMQFDEMPPDAWFDRLTRQLESDPVDVMAMVVDERKGSVRLREINLGVGLFPSVDQTRVLPIVPQRLVDEHLANEEPLEVMQDAVVILAPPPGTPIK